MPKISIVIVTFNSGSLIDSCLSSIFNQNDKSFEVIVVDNGSRDGTVEVIENSYPKVKLIKNKQNLGACRARNQAIEVLSGDWVLALDCDTVLSREFLSSAASQINNLTADIGILQPKILKTDKKTIYSCGLHLSYLRRFYDLGRDQPDSGLFNQKGYIFGACSACAFYRRKMLEVLKEKSGYFDEKFFFLVEDLDLAWRAKRKGWKSLFCPQIVSYHKGESSGLPKKMRQYLCFRNRYHSIVKNEGIFSYAGKIFPLILYDLPRFAYLLMTNKHIWSRS